MIQCIPVIFEPSSTGGMKSDVVIASACRWREGEGCHISQRCVMVTTADYNYFHTVDDLNWVELMALVRRSAELSIVGQYLQQFGSVVLWISEIQFATNILFHFSPLMQWRTIWLSVQGLIEQLLDLRASVMKLESLVAVSAAISSSLGSVSYLSGATLALAITKDVLPSTYVTGPGKAVHVCTTTKIQFIA